MPTIYFDMDGTIADLYGVDNWFNKLRVFDPSPYQEAKVMFNMSQLARLLKSVQAKGWYIGIITYTSKDSTPEYDDVVMKEKLKWLNRHLPSVEWDEIHICAYGVAKSKFANDERDILVDDEVSNRLEWINTAHAPAWAPQRVIALLHDILKK